jgi:hypothetical protein
MLTFPNVTPAAFAIVLTQLREEGSKVEQLSDDGMNFKISGHHWPLGDIVAAVTYVRDTVTVQVVKPSSWEQTIGERIGKSIEAAQRKVAGESA